MLSSSPAPHFKSHLLLFLDAVASSDKSRAVCNSAVCDGASEETVINSYIDNGEL